MESIFKCELILKYQLMWMLTDGLSKNCFNSSLGRSTTNFTVLGSHQDSLDDLSWTYVISFHSLRCCEVYWLFFFLLYSGRRWCSISQEFGSKFQVFCCWGILYSPSHRLTLGMFCCIGDERVLINLKFYLLNLLVRRKGHNLMRCVS